jgi:hypothetical protein
MKEIYQQREESNGRSKEIYQQREENDKLSAAGTVCVEHSQEVRRIFFFLGISILVNFY